MSKPQIAKVALPIPVDTCFDYLVPESLGTLEIGQRVIVPFGRQKKVGLIWSLTESTNLSSDKIKPIIQCTDQNAILDEAIIKLCDWAAKYYHHPVGEVVFSSLPNLLKKDYPAGFKTETVYTLTELGKSTQRETFKRSKHQQKAMEQLHSKDTLTASELKTLELNTNILKRLIDKGFVESTSEERVPKLNTPETTSPPLPLNEEQSQAVNAIQASINQYQSFLLNGITGSGKTEVYMQVIDKVLAEGQQVLILVPEIGLTPQMIERFEKRFAVPVATSHSGLTERQRLDIWLLAKRGNARIIIGTRSAIFIPFENLGLIIVDEEHDLSYKQQDGFRYTCRDIAVLRASQHKIPVVLGTATPSLESLYNVQNQKFKLLKLTERAGNAKPPSIEIIDARTTKAKDIIAQRTKLLVEKHLSQNQQVLFFINQRGFSPVMMCHECGTIIRCHRCDANMVLHQSPEQLRCHHCDACQPIPNNCSSCGKSELASVGVGSQQLELKLADLFPEASILRVDRDTTSNKGAFEQHLDAIHSGSANLLIGTQMLAKGHHFPNLSLVIILNIDVGLFSIDYRALERMGQLILQVAGRAGRADTPGHVLIQTHHPHHQQLHQLIHEGYGPFAESLLQERIQVGLPPASHQILVKAEAHRPNTAMGFLNHLKESTQLNDAELEVMGPIPAMMERKAGKYRAQLNLQHHNRPALHRSMQTLINTIQAHPDKTRVRWFVDVDPQEVL